MKKAAKLTIYKSIGNNIPSQWMLLENWRTSKWYSPINT